MENLDQNLVCREFLNEGKAPVWFVSTLSIQYPALKERPESARIDCAPGERCFLPHAYFNVHSKDGQEISGTFFMGPKMSLNARRRIKELRALEALETR